MGILDVLVAGCIGFTRNCVGIVMRPYETLRRIAVSANIWETPYIGVLLLLYFALASLVKTAAFRPFLLTKQFIVLTGAAMGSYLFVIIVLWYSGKIVGGKGTIKSLITSWSYTLIPTLCWFFATSILYVLIPPPRTTRIEGILFSVCYLVFSSTLLFWKVVLGYLTLRFSLHMDLGKILLTFSIAVPAIVLYSILMYRLGIFRIPFL
jgi:hypothetical protein